MLRHGFRRGGDGVVLRLTQEERAVLTDVVGQFVGLVAPEPAVGGDPLADLVGIADEVQRPTDPALLRLFPDAYGDDDDASADFRRFTEHGLREQRVARAELVLADLAAGEKVQMTAQRAQEWLLVLNDLRLVLGARLEITEDTPQEVAELRPDDPRLPGLAMYDWLSWLQSTLLRALT